MDTVEKERWHDDYDRARKEYAEAVLQHKIADDALLAATARLARADLALSGLIHRRMIEVNA